MYEPRGQISAELFRGDAKTMRKAVVADEEKLSLPVFSIFKF